MQVLRVRSCSSSRSIIVIIVIEDEGGVEQVAGCAGIDLLFLSLVVEAVWTLQRCRGGGRVLVTTCWIRIDISNIGIVVRARCT